METLPLYVSLVFGATVLLALFISYKATRSSTAFLFAVLGWSAVQAVLGLSGFYTDIHATPPRFPLLVLPPVIVMAVLFSTRGGRHFVDSLDSGYLTLLHIVRLPVELVLFWLFVHEAVPELMTFEGRNFDILSGITAPVVYFYRKRLGRALLLVWNFACLGLLLNIVFNALLSAPTPLQQFAFDRPNIAVQFFPFVLLPSVVVPLVLFAHLASIRRLLSVKKTQPA
ncbi:MAG: hypothetical protein MUD08_08455 [Cytophagales bacterium]|jgi:hypothetical protein|nr:hypothetical protein [Cytophagales bacterium]